MQWSPAFHFRSHLISLSLSLPLFYNGDLINGIILQSSWFQAEATRVIASPFSLPRAEIGCITNMWPCWQTFGMRSAFSSVCVCGGGAELARSFLHFLPQEVQ